MEVFKYLYQLYRDKDSLTKQLSIFSMVGLMVMFFLNSAGNWVNMIYDKFYILPSSNPVFIFISICFSYTILAYFVGYHYDIANKVINSEKFKLPDLSLNPLSSFLKLIPLVLVWFIYSYFIVLCCGLFIGSHQNLKAYYCLYVFIVFMIPFLLLIFCDFSKDFKNSLSLYRAGYLLRVVSRTFIDVIILSIQAFILVICAVSVIYLYFLGVLQIENEMWLWIARYFGIFIFAYLILQLSFVYFIGLANITKNKLINR